MWHDRDKFIRVYEENIKPNMSHNFVKRPYGDALFHTNGSVDTEHTPYDVFSVIVCEKRYFHSISPNLNILSVCFVLYNFVVSF